jgi:Bacterial protein of unknown function (DUF899)
MSDHTTGTSEAWLAARLELLEAENELTRRSDELARRRQELPWVRVDKEYRLETDEGPASLADLFRGRSQLIVYHFMFGPEYTAGCPSRSAIADGFDGSIVHVANHDVTLGRVCERRSRTCGRTSGGWAGASHGRLRSRATSATTSTCRTPRGVADGSRREQLPHGGLSACRGESRARGARFERWNGLRNVQARRACMSAFALEDGLVYLGLRTRDRRPLGHVPVARPRTTRTQRDLHLVAPPRRVRR